MTIITHSDIFAALEKLAPKSFAYDWDPIGLQVGNENDKTKKILVTLDVLENVADEAIASDVNLIVAHHPLLFNPIQSLDLTTPKGRILEKLIKHNITVYAAHTNLDIAEGGVNDQLCDALHITNSEPLIQTDVESLYKLSVFVPTTHVEEVRNALSEAGAGHIGNYSHCTFQTHGEGTFMPLEGTNPHIGEQHKIEFVEELKIETIVSNTILDNVVKSMKMAHPYEEVAYDLYPLKQTGAVRGLGRIGTLNEKVSAKSFIQEVKGVFNLQTVRVIGNINKKVQRIAIVGGSGEKFIHQALRQGADLYITGDITFHHAQEALENGMIVIDAGHYIEKIMKYHTAIYLNNLFPELKVIESEQNTDPFQFM